MPKRTDIKKILIIGSGPIVIGQACEFDYSGTQACKALKEDGYEVILANSNPATIMTDPETAHRTYIEPLIPSVLEKIIEAERPDVLLPTLGGQTGLNLAVTLAETGVLDKYNVEMIGAKLPAIKKAEDRDKFKAAIEKIGLQVPESGQVSSVAEAKKIVEKIGYPVIIRPSFTLGGSGGSIAYNQEELESQVQWGLDCSPTHGVLIEESIIGWKEYELEVMRDTKDNVVIICSIENFDPMGVHTGDSITVAPAQTLSDKEYQIMRDAAIKIIREIGVETGGSNIQFAVNPANGRLTVIEMNPRVSRSSALASKATGFPIAKIAAKLAVGYTLDEISNDITKYTPACFEPTIDYCVVKFPRFAFDKFPQANQTLTTQMKSVGEVMSIGRTFKEALQKSIRSLEIDRYGLDSYIPKLTDAEKADFPALVKSKLQVPNWERLWYLADALRLGMSAEEIFNLTKIDPWFIENIRQLVEFEGEIRSSQKNPKEITPELLRQAKEMGFSDKYIADIRGQRDEWHLRYPQENELTAPLTEKEIRQLRLKWNIQPVFKTVDTCAAEFKAYTPYFYSTYEQVCEANPTNRKKYMILGSGPNRIGQGVEFDYCCVQAAFALRDQGFETIMVNCNPETVSTDYDTSDRLYFEPLTVEDILAIVAVEKPDGIIVQLGGQTPLKLSVPLEKEGVKIIGTSPDNIDRAEDRERFKEVLDKLQLRQPESGIARSYEDAEKVAAQIGYPVLVRPSYVLGGRAMEIVYDNASLFNYMQRALTVSPGHPILIDKYLEKAIEVDVDAVSDGQETIVAGIMQHIEEAGIHSGDSACSLPPYSLDAVIVEEIKRQAKLLAKELNVIGLINIQFAVKDREVYILEVNPRGSRTVPFVSKAVGMPLAKIGALVMTGLSLKELGVTEPVATKHIAVKEAVFPFIKFPGVDTVLGPEMRSTGEVMGIDDNFAMAFAKAQNSIGLNLPLSGTAFLSVRDEDKADLVAIAASLQKSGFQLLATHGTYQYLKERGITVSPVNKVSEGRPHIEDNIKSGKIALLVNTASDKRTRQESYSLRRAALVYNVPYFTTIAGAYATAQAIRALQEEKMQVKPLQEYHAEMR